MPFVIGVPSLSNELAEELNYCLIFRVQDDRVIHPASLPQLPHYESLKKTLTPFHAPLYEKKSDISTLRHPHKNSTEELEKVKLILDAIGNYHKRLSDKIEEHITQTLKMDLFDFDNPKHLEALLECICAEKDIPRDFIGRFFETQLFASFTEILSKSIMDKKNRMLLKVMKLIENEEAIKQKLREKLEAYLHDPRKTRELEDVHRDFINCAKRLKNFEAMKKKIEEKGTIRSSSGSSVTSSPLRSSSANILASSTSRLAL